MAILSGNCALIGHSSTAIDVEMNGYDVGVDGMAIENRSEWVH